MNRPILLRTPRIHILVPKLRKQQSPTRINETASISTLYRRAIVAAQGSINRTRWRAAEGRVRDDVGGSEGRPGRGGDLHKEVARPGEDTAEGELRCHYDVVGDAGPDVSLVLFVLRW
jgi:hypothetical protein